jgi:hypothetical protein
MADLAIVSLTYAVNKLVNADTKYVSYFSTWDFGSRAVTNTNIEEIRGH